MDKTKFPKVGWGKERFQVVRLDEEVLEIICEVEAGVKVPTHLHLRSDEYFEAIDGELTLTMDGQTMVLRAGEKQMVPRMVFHSLRNATGAPIRFRVTFKPVANQGRLFEILIFLARRNPNDKMAIFKAMYISRQMGYEDFSISKGWLRGAENVVLGIIGTLAPVTGWNQLLHAYRSAKS